MGTTTDTGAVGAGDGKGAAETAGAIDKPDAAVGLSGAGERPGFSLPAEPSGADLAAEYETRLLARVQTLQGKFANMRAHLQHAVNGDVRAVAHAVTALVDLIEAEMTGALRH